MKKKWFLRLSSVIFAVSIWPQDLKGKAANFQISDIEVMIRHIIRLIMGLAGGIGVFFFAWGALQYLTAYGNEEKAQKGKNYLIWSIVGLIVIALSALLVNTLWKTLTPQNVPIDLTKLDKIKEFDILFLESRSFFR